MKKVLGASLFALTLSLFHTTGHTQSADVTWGEPTSFSRQSFFSKIIAETNESFYVLKTSVTSISSNDILIEKYSKTDFSYEGGFEVYSETMYSKTPGTPRLLDFDKAIMIKDGFLVFFTEFILKDKTFTSYCQKFSFDGDPIGELKSLEVFTGNDKTVIGKYEFVPSPFGDGFILVYSRPFILYSDEYFRFKFYSYDLEMQWQKEFLFPFEGKEFNTTQIKASSDSTVYMMVRVLDDNEKEREKKGNRNVTYSYNMLSFNMNPNDTNKKFRNLPMKLGKKFITNISFNVTDNREIVTAGYFADKKDMAISGAFYMRLESVSGQVRSSNMQDFSKEFLGRFVDAKYPERGVGMRDFELQDLQVLNDGTIYLIGEQYFEAITCQGQPPQMKCITEYFFNDIVVTRISNEGKVQWTSNIPKRSYDKDNGMVLSYSYIITKNKIFFLYNDLPKNLTTTLPLELKYGSGPGMVSVVASINGKGEVSREHLHENVKSKTVIRPRTSLITNGELIIYGITGKKQHWGRVKFY